MIKKISISNIGSLVNFNNHAEPFPSGHIIIHGINGSGKSLLSSVLQNITRLRLSKEYDKNDQKKIENQVTSYLSSRKSKESSSNDIKIEIDGFSANINCSFLSITQNGAYPNVFVFNEDYVKKNVGENIDFEVKNIKIGQRNKERDKLLKEIRDTEQLKSNLEENIEEIVLQARKDSGYPTQKRTQEIITAEKYLQKSNPEQPYPNAKKELKDLQNPPDSINFHHSFVFPEKQFSEDDINKVDEIFNEKLLPPELTKVFYKKHINIHQKFYNIGKSIFQKDPTICPFCLTPKSKHDENIKELIDYLDSEYSEKKEFLNDIISKIETVKSDVDSFLERWNTQISILNEKAELLSLKSRLLKIYPDNELYEKCKNLLTDKINNMTTIASELNAERSILKYFNKFQEKLKNGFTIHLDFVKNLNSSIDKLSSKKKDLGKEVIQNCMYELWNKNSLRDRIEELSEELENKKNQFESMPNAISNDRTIDFFNQIIKILGFSKYKLTEDSSLLLKIDKEYNINKEGFRISAGERKFIALAYFLSEVLAYVRNSTELKDVTIMIDDPIDSSDYYKFYSFISLIENFDNILKVIYKNDTIELGQFIILTHNALLYERFVNSQKMHHFILRTIDHRTVIEQPKNRNGLTTFSAYLKKITSYIKKMEYTNKQEIGNYIRRLLEIIASIENVENNKISNLNSSSKLNALSNHLSHESLERLIDPIPESYEYIEACIELIEEIHNRIPSLYKTIVNKYLDGKEISEYRKEYESIYLN